MNEKLAARRRRSSRPRSSAPILAPISSIMGEILFLVARPRDRHTPASSCGPRPTRSIRRRLLAVPGVSQVIPIGGGVKQYQVRALAREAAGLRRRASTEVVERARARRNQNASAGFLVEGGQE